MLYKDDRVIKFVDNDQLQAFLDNGWFRTKEEAEANSKNKPKEEKKTDEEEADEFFDSEEKSAPKKILKIKTSKK
jgi:hypothetical protein